MQNFLSKEQAAWLIERFGKQRKLDLVNKYSKQPFTEGYMSFDKIEEIINQCTEKEFPGFEMILPYWGNTHKYNVTLRSWISAYNKQEIHLITGLTEHETETACFSIEEFKQFTQGCNKIVEWLDEQA